MIKYKGGDGSIKGKAIIILGPNNEREGVDAEFTYIERKCGYFEIESQLFINDGNKQFDCLSISSVTGIIKDLWFDIRAFY